jgi:uncharacterized membrane protein YidH (DUF202 family)
MSQGQDQGPGQSQGQDEHEDGAPGLARERTSLAWTRTALSFAAVGGVVLKKDVAVGLVILAVVPLIWHVGNLANRRPDHFKLVTVMIIAVALVALGIAIFR